MSNWAEFIYDQLSMVKLSTKIREDGNHWVGDEVDVLVAGVGLEELKREGRRELNLIDVFDFLSLAENARGGHMVVPDTTPPAHARVGH